MTPPTTNRRAPARHKAQQHEHDHQTANLVCATVTLVTGLGVVVAGFAVPPLGEIHPSVLIAFGECLTFVGAVLGVRYHYKYKYGNPT